MIDSFFRFISWCFGWACVREVEPLSPPVPTPRQVDPPPPHDVVMATCGSSKPRPFKLLEKRGERMALGMYEDNESRSAAVYIISMGAVAIEDREKFSAWLARKS